MCSGGGGGDGGAADREAKRQREQNSTIGRVNSLFGVGSDSTAAAPDRNSDQFYDMVSPGPFAPKERTFNQAKYDQAMADFNKNNSYNSESVANKAKLEDMYTGVGKDVSTYLTKDLNDQYDVAGRNVRFDTARRGVRGGSSELDMNDHVNKQYDKGVLDVTNRADNATSRMRTADESTRLDIIQRVLSGMSGDAAIQSAQVSMRNNAENVKNTALAQSLDNVFGKYATLNDQNNKFKGQQAAQQFFSTYYPSMNNYSGSVN